VLQAAGAHVIAIARHADRLEELAQHYENRIQASVGDIADRPARTVRCYQLITRRTVPDGHVIKF
jgi:NADP-dependent 3-hydroxy acid dehydrogenase YdfG